MCGRHLRSSVERLVAVAVFLGAGRSYHASSLRHSDRFLSLVHRHIVEQWNLGRRGSPSIWKAQQVSGWLGVCARMRASGSDKQDSEA